MKRRDFVMGAGLIGAELGAGALLAQEGPPVQDPVERMTAGSPPSSAIRNAILYSNRWPARYLRAVQVSLEGMEVQILGAVR